MEKVAPPELMVKGAKAAAEVAVTACAEVVHLGLTECTETKAILETLGRTELRDYMASWGFRTSN